MKTYNPKEVVLYAAGVLIQGFAPDVFVKVEPTSDAFSTEVGADGEVVRVGSVDKRAKVTLTLLQTSLSNDVLSAVLRTDRNSTNGSGVFVFQMQDLSGTSLVHGEQAWITKPPVLSRASSQQANEWEIEIAEADIFVGGALPL